MKFSNAAASLLFLLGSSVTVTAQMEMCMPYFLTFEVDAEGNQLQAGTFADDVDWPLGLTITAEAGNTGGQPRRPMLFNSTGDPISGEDPDLATPDEFLVLIISEDNNQMDPDDNAQSSGTWFFNFAAPVKITDMEFLDLEEQAQGDIKIFDCDGNMLVELDTPEMDNGERERIAINQENVCRMEVFITGSGAITDVQFCVPTGVFGDPHFNLWNGKSYDYHGVCDLMFLESPAHDLTIHLRTSQKFHYSYVSSAAIKIKEDIFEFGAWGQVIRNGMFAFQDEGVYDLSETLGGHKLTKKVDNKKEHTYLIEFGNGGGIEVKSFKEMVAVRLVGSSAHFEDAVGLMGNPTTGAKLSRSGQIMRDDNVFGMEWQVLETEPKLFEDKARFPQAPQNCHIPVAKESARRLGESMARGKAEEACAKWTMNKESCIQDVMITGDLEMAAAFYN